MRRRPRLTKRSSPTASPDGTRRAGDGPPLFAATTATFDVGAPSVSGDSLDNNVTISRDAAGKLLVNGGAVTVAGGSRRSPTPR
jgi:hypothetical protein